jgi:predicted neuraminidase
MVFLLTIFPAFIFNAHCAEPAKPEKAKPVVEAQYSRDAFVKHVTDAGGRVDFVFEEDRPFKQCHASTVVEAADGSLVSAWFAGTKESDPDVSIWMSRFVDGKWTAPVRAAKVNESAHWNPVLFRDGMTEKGKEAGLILFFKVGPEIPKWRTYWMRSDDNGKTWSEPCELVPGDAGGRGPVKNKPIVLSDGAWLAPASTEHGGWKAFVDRSEDCGKTWTRTKNFPIRSDSKECKRVIQPTLWESVPGQVHAMMRSSGGSIMRTDSADGGKTWAPAYKTSLPNNNSGLDALRLDDGRLFLVYNPVDQNWGERTPLSLAVSSDDGKTWTNLAHLESAPGEYSYPAITRAGKNIAITYTWKRERVCCWNIPIEALK